MRTYHFLINPVSGAGNRQKTIDLIAKVFSVRKEKYKIKLTEYAGHAIELAKEICSLKNSVVVAVGGDGSVNEVAQGVMGSETAMAILPQGSGNGLARHLKISMDSEKALNTILEGTSIKMDAGTLNGKPFFVTCGIGFDAEVSYNFANGNLRGLAGYVKESVLLYPNYKTKKYKVSSNENASEIEAFSISVANASQYGNGAVIAKNASVSDGLLDICIIKKYPKLFGAQVGLSMFMQNLHASKYYSGEQAKHFKIEKLEAEQACHAHIDGESIETKFPIEVKIIPAVVKIIAAKNVKV